MRLMFVYWKVEDAGSAQDIYNYCQAAKRLGHDVALYASEGAVSRFPCSLDIESADGVIFPLEWNIYLHNNEPLDLERPMAKVPRHRRVIIDCDGMYNDAIHVDGDYNHTDKVGSQARIELYDRIADKIFQPTLRPLRSNVRPFLFHAYSPEWEQPLDFAAKEYGMCYVGTNWFRWWPMRRVLDAIEPIRQQVGRIGLTGHNWLEPPGGADPALREAAYHTDPAYFQRMGVEVMPAVPIEEVIPTMSRGIFNPVLIRPLFSHLGLVTVRTFETPAANTIPLFAQDPAYVEAIYGEEALELVLPDKGADDKIVDIIRWPTRYVSIVKAIRRHLIETHSYEARLKELIEIVKS
jgi:hypothetical protein